MFRVATLEAWNGKYFSFFLVAVRYMQFHQTQKILLYSKEGFLS